MVVVVVVCVCAKKKEITDAMQVETNIEETIEEQKWFSIYLMPFCPLITLWFWMRGRQNTKGEKERRKKQIGSFLHSLAQSYGVSLSAKCTVSFTCVLLCTAVNPISTQIEKRNTTDTQSLNWFLYMLWTCTSRSLSLSLSLPLLRSLPYSRCSAVFYFIINFTNKMDILNKYDINCGKNIWIESTEFEWFIWGGGGRFFDIGHIDYNSEYFCDYLILPRSSLFYLLMSDQLMWSNVSKSSQTMNAHRFILSHGSLMVRLASDNCALLYYYYYWPNINLQVLSCVA